MCQQGWFPWKPLSLACRWPATFFVLTWSFLHAENIATGINWLESHVSTVWQTDLRLTDRSRQIDRSRWLLPAGVHTFCNPLPLSMGRICNLMFIRRIWQKWWDRSLYYVRLHYSRLEWENSYGLEKARCCDMNCLERGPRGKELWATSRSWDPEPHGFKEMSYAKTLNVLEVNSSPATFSRWEWSPGSALTAAVRSWAGDQAKPHLGF